MPCQNNYKEYRLSACDGSNLTIATNPNNAETAYKSNQFGTITNHLHLNAFYDLLNRIYLDAVLQTASEYQECRACINMMEKSTLSKAVLVADRGYENYNIMAHAINKGWKFVIRIKDINSNGIASDLKLPRSKGTYTIRFRIARFAIAEDSYEMVVTNLERSEFPTEDLKERNISINIKHIIITVWGDYYVFY